MRDKIIIRGKFSFKTVKRPPVKNKRREMIEKFWLEREL
jgi:hypothetical protein